MMSKTVDINMLNLKAKSRSKKTSLSQAKTAKIHLQADDFAVHYIPARDFFPGVFKNGKTSSVFT